MTQILRPTSQIPLLLAVLSIVTVDANRPVILCQTLQRTCATISPPPHTVVAIPCYCFARESAHTRLYVPSVWYVPSTCLPDRRVSASTGLIAASAHNAISHSELLYSPHWRRVVRVQTQADAAATVHARTGISMFCWLTANVTLTYYAVAMRKQITAQL